MNKKHLRILSVLLCFLMLAPCLLAGCGKKDPGNTPAAETTQKQTAHTEGNDLPEEPSTLVIYPEFDERIRRDYLYTVSVTQGDKTATLPVYNHATANGTTRNPLDTSSDENRRFSTFAFDPAGGGVRVDITVNRDFESYSVIPSAKKFRNQFQRGVISVWLDQPDYFVIRLDDMDSTILSVFADEPETEVPTKNSKTIIVDGWKDVDGGILELKKQGMTVYIKPGSVLNARIKVSADDCRILGRGAIIDPFSDIYQYDEAVLYDTEDGRSSQPGLIWVRNANNAQIDGVHLLNSKGYNVYVQGVWDRTYAKNNRVTNLKILSTVLCSDGIAFNYWNKNSQAEHCFVYCGDNALVYEDEAHYKDITIGTTCSALYPQTDVRNSSLEDIYVFRSDDNIVRANANEGEDMTRIDNHTITNFYLQDVIATNSFLHMTRITTTVVSSNGGLTMKNVYLPDIDGIKSNFYSNTVPGDYEVNLINVFVDGNLIAPQAYRSGGYIDPGRSWGRLNYAGSHTFTYTTTTDYTPGVKKHAARVNYQNDLNVMIGIWQVYYSDPILREGDDILLPLKQTQKELRTNKSATVIERNGVQYVAASSLVSAGMAKAAKTDGNNLVLTPNYNGENLILADSGILPQFGESNPGEESLFAIRTDDGVTLRFTVGRASSQYGYGLYCVLNEAVKKYGAGNYQLTFKAKSDSNTQLTAGIGYGKSDPSAAVKVTAGADGTVGTLNFSVSAAYQKQLQIYLTIYADWSRDGTFELTDLSLVKVS